MPGFPRPLNDKFIKYFKKLILDIVEFESWVCDPDKTYLATLLDLGNAACLANHGFSLFLLAHSLKCFFFISVQFSRRYLVHDQTDQIRPLGRLPLAHLTRESRCTTLAKILRITSRQGLK